MSDCGTEVARAIQPNSSTPLCGGQPHRFERLESGAVQCSRCALEITGHASKQAFTPAEARLRRYQ